MLFYFWVTVIATLISKCVSFDLRLEPENLNLVLGENLYVSCTIGRPLRNRYNASNLAFRFYLQDPSFVSSSHQTSSSKKDKDCNDSDEAVSNEIDLEDEYFYNTTDENPSDCPDDFNTFMEPGESFEKVDPNYVEIINKYKVRLEYPNVRKRLDEGTLRCFIDKKDNVPQNVCISAHILAGERPHVPIITNFKMNNWEKFEFHWKTEEKNDVYKTVYRAWYKRSSSSDFIECPHADEKCAQYCLVNIDLKPDHDASASTMIFKVNAVNLVGSATSPEKVVNLYDIVTPDPVSDVKVTCVNSSACVKFKSTNISAEMKYEVSFSCAGQLYTTIHPKSKASIVEECVSGLPSYSNCSVSIRAKPYSYGLWGNVSDLERFTVPQQVPLGAPEVCRSCFELLSTDGDKACSVRVFLKPLSLAIARGRVSEYRASLSMHNRRRTSVNETFFSADISGLDFSGLDLKSSYSIAVVAATDVGYNQSIVATPVTLSLSYVKTLSSWPRNITAFILNGTTVRLSWLCKRPKISGFTVFWCRVTNFKRCKDPLQWSHVLSNVTHFDVTDLPASDLVNYLFGVAVETADGYSSGVVWTKCLYNISRVSSPPQIKNRLSGTKVRLNFSKDECYGGFPYAYRVTYCPLLEENKICPGSAKELIVDNDSCEVDHLALGTKYLFVVSSLSVAGPSLMNSSFRLSIPSASGSSHTIWIICLVASILFVVIGLVSLYHKRMEAFLDIRITPPDYFLSHGNRLQIPSSSGGSQLYPSYAQLNGNLPRTTHDMHENGSALSNGLSSHLDSCSDHLIPNTPHGVQEPPFRAHGAADDEDDNASVASDNQPDIYTHCKLCNKPDVVPSSPPVEPNEGLFLQLSVALDLGDGDSELRDLPEPGLLVDALGGSSSTPGNESNISSCGYAVGRVGDQRSGPLLSSADDVSIQMYESRIDEDAGNGQLLRPLVMQALVDEAENSNHARSGRPQSRPSVPDDSPLGSISGSSDDVTSDHLQPCSSAVVQVIPPDGSGDDDDYSSSVCSSSDYAFANFKNKEYDPQLNTPAADISSPEGADSDGDSDKYATVSFLSDKQTAASNDNSPQAQSIPLLSFSASAP